MNATPAQLTFPAATLALRPLPAAPFALFTACDRGDCDCHEPCSECDGEGGFRAHTGYGWEVCDRCHGERVVEVG